MSMPILQPVVALLCWSLVMLLWMLVTRIPALKGVGIDLGTAKGGRPGALDGLLPERTQWKAHNYIHLMEQPTLFYAVCLVLAVIGAGGGLNNQLAWGYVALRVLHSLVQATTNVIRFRFILFALSSLCLGALIVHAAIAVF